MGFNFKNRETAVALRDVIEGDQPPEVDLENGVKRLAKVTDSFIVETPVGGIAAISGTQPGEAECTPHYINTTAANPDLQELNNIAGSSQTLTVYNFSGNAIAANQKIVAAEVFGRLVAIDPSGGRALSRVTGLSQDDIAATEGPHGLTLVEGIDATDVSSLSNPLNVYNPHLYTIDQSALVRAEYNQTQERWEIYAYTCPAP